MMQSKHQRRPNSSVWLREGGLSLEFIDPARLDSGLCGGKVTRDDQS